MGGTYGSVGPVHVCHIAGVSHAARTRNSGYHVVSIRDEEAGRGVSASSGRLRSCHHCCCSSATAAAAALSPPALRWLLVLLPQVHYFQLLLLLQQV